MADETDPAEKKFKQVSTMAKELGLAGDEASKYIHEHMVKLGFGHRRTYFTKKQSGGKSGGGFLGFGGGSSDDDDDDV
jgi:uncharacterized membrane protein